MALACRRRRGEGPRATLVACVGAALLASCDQGRAQQGATPLHCESGGHDRCAKFPGYRCANTPPAGFNCIGMEANCPDPNTQPSLGIPEHAQALISADPYLSYSMSVPNGTAVGSDGSMQLQINNPQATISCLPGYAGLPTEPVFIACNCQPGPFGTTPCSWTTYADALVPIVERLGISPASYEHCTKRGCTDPHAVNYDPQAAADDGSCTAKNTGCMDSSAANYSPYFNDPCESCCITKEDVDGNDCDPDPCNGHGSCHDLFKAYHCHCNVDWTGTHCETPQSGEAPPPPAGECRDGMYKTVTGECMTCKACAVGKAERSACTPTSNTVCEDCPSGRYNDGSWAVGGCRDCSVCCPGWSLDRICTNRRDTQCAECPPGKYVGAGLFGQGTCLPCDGCSNPHEVCVHQPAQFQRCTQKELSEAKVDCETHTEPGPPPPSEWGKCLNGGQKRSRICIPRPPSESVVFGATVQVPGAPCACNCPSEWIGQFCETASPCLENPCQNGGGCAPKRDAVEGSEQAYTCTCPAGWTGDHCETAQLSCDPCCGGHHACSDGDTHDCEEEDTAACDAEQQPATCEPACEHGGTCVPMGFDDLMFCSCILPYTGQGCHKLDKRFQSFNNSSTEEEDGAPTPFNDMQNVARGCEEDGSNCNMSTTLFTVLSVVATAVLCAALVVVVLKCKKKREGKRRENLELEMRQTPSGPTGLGHLRGSIKDESQLTYTAEPGFEDFDYDPTKEGAGEDYIEALQTPRDGVGKGKKMLRKGAELLSLRKGAEGALEASLLSQPQPS